MWARGTGRKHPRFGGGWAVADQALYAGANFALNVVLARALAPEAYGAFTTAFVAFLLLGAVHGGLLIEPVLVFGAGRLEGRRDAYLRWAVRAHGRAAAAMAAVLGAAAVTSALLNQPVLAAALGGFALAQAGILVHWLLRRACHLDGRTDRAAASGALYLVLVLGGTATTDAAGMLTAVTAPLIMGGASLAAAAVLAVALGVGIAPPGGLVGRAAGAAHRSYGRYAAGSGVLEWAQGAMPFVVVPLFAGLEGAAQLRAVYNLAMPALQAGAAVTVLCIPLFVAAGRRGDMPATAVRVGRVLVAGAIAYGLVVGLLGEHVIVWLYGGAYAAGPTLRWAVAALPVVSVMAGLLVAVHRAMERPGSVLAARALSMAAGLALAFLLTAWVGVGGAVLAAAATIGGEFLLLAARLRRPGGGARLPASVQPALAP